MDAAVAAIIGGLVGAGASVLGMLIQQHHQTKRERVKVASDLGLAEYQGDLDLAKYKGGVAVVAPLGSYVIFYSRFLEALAKGPITPEIVKQLSDEKKIILHAFPGAP